jgi:hypothetical protein
MTSLRRITAVLLLLCVAAAGGDKRDDESKARTAALKVAQEYLAARFRGGDWKREVAPLVLWDEDQEPPCVSVARSYAVDSLRFKDKRTAMVTVIFYTMGDYCPAGPDFKPAPHIDTALFQLRHASVTWLVEKTNRPGSPLDWKVLRERLKQKIADPDAPAGETARASAALDELERVSAAVGKQGFRPLPNAPQSPQ